MAARAGWWWIVGAAMTVAATGAACTTSSGAGGDADAGDTADDGPAPVPWEPKAVMRAAEIPPVRGFTARRGSAHMHSPYSHDACDNNPLIDGAVNEPCRQSWRRGVCNAGVDFVFLTDHGAHFAEFEYPAVLQHDPAAGDTLIERGGKPRAGRLKCPDGHTVVVAAGTETAMMPIGLEEHAGADEAARKAVYGRVDADTVRLYQGLGAKVFLQHTEEWDIDKIIALPIDGIEIYNIHTNLIRYAGDALRFGAALGTKPETVPIPELALTSMFREVDADLERWAKVVQVKHVGGIAATDSHENVFNTPTYDGERLDSFRRLLHWFTNYVLVRGDEHDDRDYKNALADGRSYVMFQYLGYAVGFDWRAETAAKVYEMGENAPAGSAPTLKLTLPRVWNLDPAAPAPAIRGRILRAEADGRWTEVAAGTTDLLVSAAADGVYRAEVRIKPEHLRPWLGNEPDKYTGEKVWVYGNVVGVGAPWPAR